MTLRKPPMQTKVARHSVNAMVVDRIGLFFRWTTTKAYG
jgi:hypothetical protein